MKTHVIYGPPGTGKTTTLMGLLENVVQKNAPKDVTFVSHTKAAAREAVSRVGGMIPDKNVSTIHALCYRACDMHTSQIVDNQRLVQFGREAGYRITGRRKDMNDTLEEGDEYISILSYAKNREIEPKQAYLGSDRPGTLAQFEAFAADYANWKEEFGLYDFDDMLKLLLDIKPRFGSRALFVDEAQDLSPLQWKVVKHLIQDCRLVYVAGDDDQAIFVWGGAKPDGMVDFERDTNARRKILDQSYRVPQAVHGVANEIINRCASRVDKAYRPRSDTGVVDYSGDLSYTDISGDDVLILFRDLGGRADVVEFLEVERIPYLTLTGYPGPLQNKWGRALRAWCSRERELSAEDVRTIEKVLNEEGKRAIGKGASINLLRASENGWSQFIDVPRTLYGYYSQLDWSVNPNLRISTIHGVKGQEADHVVLYTAMSQRTEQSYVSNPDSEHRVWYVGATRAKRKLTVVEGPNGYPIP